MRDTFYRDCDGSYECDADEHITGCLSHAIDPPSEIEVVAEFPAHEQPASLDRLVQRGRARRYRDESDG